MLGLLRQLFGDKERASFASMLALLRAHADPSTPEGQRLLDVVGRFELLNQGVLDSWGVLPGRTEDSHPPLDAFLDWTYGEYLHSDADKGQVADRPMTFTMKLPSHGSSRSRDANEGSRSACLISSTRSG